MTMWPYVLQRPDAAMARNDTMISTATRRRHPR